MVNYFGIRFKSNVLDMPQDLVNRLQSGPRPRITQGIADELHHIPIQMKRSHRLRAAELIDSLLNSSE